MKWKGTYIPEEEDDIQGVVAYFKKKYPCIKVRESNAHPPFKHIYLTARKPGKPCHFKEKRERRETPTIEQ